MNKILSLIFFSSLLYSCSVKQHADTETRLEVELDNSISPSFKEMFSSIEIIPLETRDNCLLMNVEKVIPCQKGYFVFDNLKPAFYVFDENGYFVKEIARKGDGPGEYQLISDAVTDEKNGKIYLLSPYGFLLEYDWDGNYVEKIDLPIKPNYYSMAILGDNENFALWSCVESEEDGITIINQHNHALVNSYWKNDRMLDMGLPTPFYVYNGKNYFASAYQSKVYNLRADSLVCNYYWDFGNNGIDDKKLLNYSKIENSGERNQKILQDLENGILPFAMDGTA
ncbi:MAG: 6-bladed beta-propeller [Bacteroides sp.]|nr:6-bladed beta-propeller [Bacteroides sp.]